MGFAYPGVSLHHIDAYLPWTWQRQPLPHSAEMTRKTGPGRRARLGFSSLPANHNHLPKSWHPGIEWTAADPSDWDYVRASSSDHRCVYVLDATQTDIIVTVFTLDEVKHRAEAKR